MAFNKSKSTTIQNTSTNTEDKRAQADGGAIVATGGGVTINNAGGGALFDSAIAGFQATDAARLDLVQNSVNGALNLAQSTAASAAASAADSQNKMHSFTRDAQASASGDLTTGVKAVLAGVFVIAGIIVWKVL